MRKCELERELTLPTRLRLLHERAGIWNSNSQTLELAFQDDYVTLLPRVPEDEHGPVIKIFLEV